VRIGEMKVLMMLTVKMWRALSLLPFLFLCRGLVHGSKQSKLTF
jgi:hypothetical protein